MTHGSTRLLLALVILWLGAACGGGPPPTEDPPTAEPSPTPKLPPADEVAFAFLQAWQRADYPAMYALLSPERRAHASEDEFITLYESVAEEASIREITPRILGSFQPGPQAEVGFTVQIQTVLVGDFDVQNQMILNYQEGRWGVDWSPALIFPQLSDETFVRMTTYRPSRGNIYDRNGLGLAVQGEQVEVGIVPGDILDEPALLAQLSAILGRTIADLREEYADARPDWYVPLGRVSAEAAQTYYPTFEALPGIRLRRTWTRSYRPEIIAPHLVGIVGPIPQGELELWREQGYSGDEMVGRIGLERWGEPYLAGERGARLQIDSDKGATVAVLADRPARENRSLYTTFDREFQQKVQDILGQQLGAIAVLEAQTGRVLALATYPLFDPNPFATGISEQQWSTLQADLRRPLVNRATQGTYPLGSVFKIVSMMAGMQAGGLTTDSAFICRGTWTGLGPQWPKTCWLRSGHGTIALNRALTVSCDITFYQVGLLLNGLDQDVLPAYARSSGFGAATGIEVEENPGLVPDPAWKILAKGEGWAPGDTVNLAIGQGELQVTPLQTAAMVAAVGNGGQLYRPQIVEMIAADRQSPDWTFAPSLAGGLPVSAENLAVIQDSLHKVTSQAYGTAYSAFKGLELAVAGKTGTAESGREDPHSWFAGYAPAENPEIAIAVVVENSGEGSKFAAPLFRQVVEAYFGIEPPGQESTGTGAQPDSPEGGEPTPPAPGPAPTP